MKLKMKDILKQTEFYVFCIIVAFAFIIQVRSGQFFTSNNLMDLVRSMIIPGIYAICALLSFVSTGADVSFPLIAALSAYCSNTGQSIFIRCYSDFCDCNCRWLPDWMY